MSSALADQIDTSSATGSPLAPLSSSDLISANCLLLPTMMPGGTTSRDGIALRRRRRQAAPPPLVQRPHLNVNNPLWRARHLTLLAAISSSAHLISLFDQLRESGNWLSGSTKAKYKESFAIIC